jgi:hypothetical protein
LAEKRKESLPLKTRSKRAGPSTPLIDLIDTVPFVLNSDRADVTGILFSPDFPMKTNWGQEPVNAGIFPDSMTGRGCNRTWMKITFFYRRRIPLVP